jgi:hypothetical protein
MASAAACVRHAVLALAGTYVLDYTQDPRVLDKVNSHYRKAAALITDALKQTETHDIGKGDPVIAAILLLTVDDAVTWELRTLKAEPPKLYKGYLLARKILDQSDPGHRYYRRENVQCDNARVAQENRVAFCCVVSQPVMPLIPLDEDEDSTRSSWLLQGSERDVRRIHGASGVSPKLLHVFGQITYLCQCLVKTPNSTVTPMGGRKIEEVINNFRQWSDFSEGYAMTTELLDSCVLDEMGKVTDSGKVTELTGETWVCAAKIYLQCRFFRFVSWHWP